MEQHLKIASNIKNIQQVEQMIDAVSDELDLDKTIYGNMLISVFEAVNNAILHGNQQNDDSFVNVDFHYNEEKGQVSIFIEDEGKGFDYYNIPDPTAKENLERINGRGIFLMKQLADNIVFHNKGSKVELNFKV